MSFFLITWTWPILQPLNKTLLEVLLIKSTHLALMVFSLGFRRKIAQDYQAPLVDILKRQISRILKWPKFFSKPQTLTLFAPNKKWLSREQISKFSKNFKSSSLGFFPYLLTPNICDSQAFHSFDCLWRLNLSFFLFFFLFFFFFFL